MEAGCPAGGASAPRREAGGVFRREVESAVRRLNPWMTEAGAVAVVERLEALPSTIEGNRELLAWLRGERQWYDEAEERSRRVRPADLDNSASNALHVTWEWRIKPPARKGNRADVVFLDTASARCIHRTAVGNQTFAAREAPAVPAQGALSPVRVPILGIMWRPSLSSFPVGGSFRLRRAAQR